MNANLFSDLMAIIVEQAQGETDYLHLADEACGGRPLYATHHGKITNLSTRTRITMPHDPNLIKASDTVFTAAGFRYLYPNDLIRPADYDRLDAALLSATFCGEEDPETARVLVERSFDREMLSQWANADHIIAFLFKGSRKAYHTVDPETLIILGKVMDAVHRAGEDEEVHLYVMPYRGQFLLTLAVSGIWLQFMPKPLAAGSHETASVHYLIP